MSTKGQPIKFTTDLGCDRCGGDIGDVDECLCQQCKHPKAPSLSERVKPYVNIKCDCKGLHKVYVNLTKNADMDSWKLIYITPELDDALRMAEAQSEEI